jgi:hypothetical protein
MVAGTAATAPASANGTSAIKKLLRIATARAKKRSAEKASPGEIGLSKPNDPACQQRRADDGNGGTEKAPLLGGEDRDAKADRHQGDTKCRTGREGGFEGDNSGCHRDRAKRHQHIDRQRSGVTSSNSRVMSRTILMAVASSAEYPDESCASSSYLLSMRRTGYWIVKEFEAAPVVAS